MRLIPLPRAKKINLFLFLHVCREFKCKDTVISLYDLVGGNLEVKLAGNKTYIGLPSRSSGKFLSILLLKIYENS